MLTLIGFIIFYFLIIVLKLRKNRQKEIINPVFWLVFSWALIAGLYLTSGVSFSNSISIRSSIYISIVIAVFVISFWFGKILKNRYMVHHNLDKDNITWVNTYIVISIIGLVFWLFDIIRLNYVSIGSRIENFEISLIGVVSLVLINASLVVWLYGLTYAMKYNSKMRIKYVFAAITYLIPSILTSGRQAFLIIFLSSFAIFLFYSNGISSRIVRKRIRFFMISLIVIVILYFTFITNVRSGVVDKNMLFEYVFNSKTSDSTLSFVNFFGNFRNLLLEGIYYYNHEIPMFSLFYENYDGPLFLGMFQLHYIGRRLPMSFNLHYDIAWFYLDSLFSNHGIYSHTWRTALASFIIDFGRVGAVFFVAFLGFITGKIYKNNEMKKSIYSMICLVIANVGIFYSIQFSPFNEVSWVYPIIWLILLPLIPNIRLE